MDNSPGLDSSCASTQHLKISKQKSVQFLEATRNNIDSALNSICKGKSESITESKQDEYIYDQTIPELDRIHHYFREDKDNDCLTEDDEAENITRRKPNIHDHNPYEFYFKPMVFAKAFISHALFFLCLGPFIAIFAPIFGTNSLRNQGFLGFTSTFAAQTIQYLIIITFLLILYIVDIHGLHSIEVYMMVIALLVRIIIISSKYSYQCTEYLRLFDRSKFTQDELNKRAMVGAWNDQSDEVIREEIQTAILRLEIDSSLFFFNFLGSISPELQLKLEKLRCARIRPVQADPCIGDVPQQANDLVPCISSTGKIVVEELSENGKAISEVGDESSIKKRHAEIKKSNGHNQRKKKVLGSAMKKAIMSISYYFSHKPHKVHSDQSLHSAFSHFFETKRLEANNLSGYSLAVALMEYARDHRFRHLGTLVLVISLIRALIPTLYRIYTIKVEHQKVALFTSQPIIVVLLFLINTYFFYINTFVLGVAVCDIKARVCNFKQVGFLISPRKISYFVNRKLYPTLNIFCPITLKTWTNLRRVMFEYGKEYRLRNNLNISVVMAAYSLVVCIIVLQLFGVLNAYGDPMLLLVLGFESVVYFTIFIQVMTGTAFINEQYKVHKYLLTKNKSIIADFHRLSHVYAGKDAITPDNIIYREGLKLLKQELGEENFKEKVVERAETLIMMIDDAVSELEFEEINEPFTVMGIAINYTLLKTAVIGVTSVLFGLSQTYIKKNKKLEVGV